MKSKGTIWILFVLALSFFGCGIFVSKPSNFYLIRSEQGYFLSDYTNNSGVLIMEEVDPEVTFFTKVGKKKSGKITVPEFVKELQDNPKREMAIIFFRDANNNRINIALSFKAISYNEETREVKINIEFVSENYQVREISLRNISLLIG